MTYVIISGLSFFAVFVLLTRGILQKLDYEVIIAGIHLLFFVFIREFTFELVLYLFFALLPFIRKLKKLNRWVFITLVYILFQVVRGLMRSFYPTISTFCVMYFAVLFICMVDFSNEKTVDDSVLMKLVRTISVLEILIFVVLLRFRGREATSFLVVNHQPVGGNLSIVGILLVLLIAQGENRRLSMNCLPHIVLYVALALECSIRGYQLIVFPFAVISVYKIITKKYSVSVGILASSLFGLIVILIAVALGITTPGSLMNKLDTNIGYRVAENRFAVKAMIHANPLRLLFGYGLFSTGKQIGSETIARSVSRSIYHIRHVLEDGRYLNLWIDIFKDCGIVGLVLMARLYFWIRKKYQQRCMGKTQFKTLMSFCLLYAILLAFRNSCTCGMLELLVLHYLTANYSPADTRSDNYKQYA